jgi:FtsP/CotA-like multicopper oxidase with cupredoxin domain
MLIRRGQAHARAVQEQRRVIAESGVTRRELIKMGILGTTGAFLARRGLYGSAAADEVIPSPPTRPFVEPLPVPPVLQPVSSLSPAPSRLPVAGEARALPHQAFARCPPARLYETHAEEVVHSFHPDLPPNLVWGFDGFMPGPTILARYGEPVLVRRHNDLPQDHRGFGSPQISIHLHNGHTPSESDGFPCDFFPSPGLPGALFSDAHYPNALAGFSGDFFPTGDPCEMMSTLWYHDHRVGFTAPNVYKGLTGFYLLFDDRDTGDETTGFGLPSGAFDVPMALADKAFDAQGQLFFDLFAFDGILGDKLTVNGKIQPFFQVHPRRYRLRWLNVGPSRFYQLFLTDPADPGRVVPFTLIAADGNLLPASQPVTSVELVAAARVDVIVDFSQVPHGSSLILENRLEQTGGRGPTGKILPAGQGDALMRFDVVLGAVEDPSRPPPYTFFEAPRPTAAELAAARVRTFRFERGNGQWQVNGALFDCDTVIAEVPAESDEVWVFQSSSGGWEHPVHVHQEECLLLSRNGLAPTPAEVGRRDVLRLGPGEELRTFRRFRDFVGRYPIHCHNVLHEDHEMMARFDIVPR